MEENKRFRCLMTKKQWLNAKLAPTLSSTNIERSYVYGIYIMGVLKWNWTMSHQRRVWLPSNRAQLTIFLLIDCVEMCLLHLPVAAYWSAFNGSVGRYGKDKTISGKYFDEHNHQLCIE